MQERSNTMVYHVPNRSEQTRVVEFNFFYWKKRGAKNHSEEFINKSCPRLYALNMDTTIMDVKKLIFEKMRGIFRRAPEDDENLNDMIEVHIKDSKSRFPKHNKLKFDNITVNDDVESA